MWQPLRTIQAAITRGTLGRNVSVMQGTYNEASTITLANGVSLLGGFASDCSRPEVGRCGDRGGAADGDLRQRHHHADDLELLTIEGARQPQPSGSAYGLFALNSSGLVIQRSTIIAGNSGAGTNGSTGRPARTGRRRLWPTRLRGLWVLVQRVR